LGGADGAPAFASDARSAVPALAFEFCATEGVVNAIAVVIRQNRPQGMFLVMSMLLGVRVRTIGSVRQHMVSSHRLLLALQQHVTHELGDVTVAQIGQRCAADQDPTRYRIG
jgi:hypothetical protein